jgi:hypothetical protein
VHIFALAVNLVGRRHHLVELLFGNADQTGMGHPGAVVAVFGFALFVGAHFSQRRLIGFRIVLNRNLGRHAAHGVNAAPVAGFDKQQRVGAHHAVVIVTSARSGMTKWG